MIEDAIFLSIKPHYAEEILIGNKTVELRRICPQVNRGGLVILYASSPVKAVLGAFTIERIVTAPPQALWSEVRGLAGISRTEFDDYYVGAERGIGLFVRSTHRAHTPFSLENLRRLWPEFHPPQGFRYLRSMRDKAAVMLEHLGWQRRTEEDICIEPDRSREELLGVGYSDP